VHLLVANGSEAGQSFRRALPEGVTIRLGRAPQRGWQVPWDLYISREQADVTLRDGKLHVRCADEATNPAYFHGKQSREFVANVGEAFRIGKTTFTLTRIEFQSPPEESIVEKSFDRLALKTQLFSNADQRLEVLCDLPEVIQLATTEEEFGRGLVQLLLAGIPHASAVAMAQFDVDRDPEAKAPLRLYWEARDGENLRFRPSQRLIRAALATGESKLHMWSETLEQDPSFTATADLDWAFCTPIDEPGSRDWCIYVSGKVQREIKNEDDLTGDVRFAELIAQTTVAIRQVRSLEKRSAGLAQFFSPAVMEALHGPDAEELLKPTQQDITVLFCDIRGFSRQAEEVKDDLETLLRRTSEALGLMTREIIARDGVIADFQGDAALAFWGWPLPAVDGPLPACEAALAIARKLDEVRDVKDHPLAGFRVGIGIAHGRAIAGKIGAPEQAKVGVLGPVVNLGSRLEAMTKQLGAPILLDEATATYARQHLPPDAGRVRRTGRVLPYGLKTPLVVSHLLPPPSEEPRVTDEGIANFEAAVDAVAAGDWAKALELLENVPGPDRAKDFLTVFIAQNNYEPPPDWDGTIVLPRK
jgi:adenylate cyclase